MKSRNINVDDYIPDIYKKARYISVYEPIIYPVNGTNLWVRTEYPDVQPPKFKKMPGRPKKRRNREQGEIDGTDRKIRKTGMVLRCTRCRQIGHNKSTCKRTQPPQDTQATATQQTPSQATATQITTTQQPPTATQTTTTQQPPTATQTTTTQQTPTATQTRASAKTTHPTHPQPTATQPRAPAKTTQPTPSQATTSQQRARATPTKAAVTRPQKLPYKKPRQSSITIHSASKGPTTRLNASQNAVGPTTRRTTPTKRNNTKKSFF
ncbi:uncharacterized protein LOC131650808 [Vicia villosa]|uniref:uncharacterized protein LOC131650808 n=1 Tax=Vicia villosa TaxID=3911 RepID=UPI00273C122E|nr:uncharacterized protein LOC131650808 [Vicia villosa]